MKKALLILFLIIGGSLSLCKAATPLSNDNTSADSCLIHKSFYLRIDPIHNDTINLLIYRPNQNDQLKSDTIIKVITIINTGNLSKKNVTYSVLPLWLSVIILIMLVALFVIILLKQTPRQDSNTNAPSEDKKLSNELNKLQQEKKELLDKIDSCNDIIEKWQSIGFDNPKKAKNEIDDLKKDNNILNQIKDDYDELVQALKTKPQSLKENRKFSKLSAIIEKAEYADKIMDNPELVDKDSKTGQIIKKGRDFERCLENPQIVLNASEYKSTNLAHDLKNSYLLDKIKNNVGLIMNDSDNDFKDTDLKNMLSFVYDPKTIANTKYKDTGLYKLITSIENLSTKDGANINNINYEWLKEHLSFIVENATKYLHFGAYKYYWKNMSGQLLSALNDLHNNDDIYNTRLLLFYASQLLSISCIMSKIHGDYRLSSTRFEANVSVFNVEKPMPLSEFGIPVSKVDLNDYLFEYKGDPDEDDKIDFLKKYKPLPFVFINSYYSDNILK